MDNLNADHLSRPNHLPDASEDSEGLRAAADEAMEFKAGGTKTLVERCGLCVKSVGVRPEPPAALERYLLIHSQDADDDLRTVKGWIQDGSAPASNKMAGSSEDLKSYRQILEKLEVTDDNLLVLKYRLN